jgi:hypothetical protein
MAQTNPGIADDVAHHLRVYFGIVAFV